MTDRAELRPGDGHKRGEPRALRLLLTSAGRRVALLECFRAAAAELGVDLIAHATDLDPDHSAACLSADAAHAVPRCDASDYIEATLRICERERIDFLVPTIDTELLPLARTHPRFGALGTRVAVGTAGAVAIARDKVRTAERLAAAGVPVPRTAKPEEARAGALGPGPLFVKPVGGSASRGLMRVERAADLPVEFDEPMLVQECLQGPEYTVNAFVDAEGRWRAAVPHRRLSVRAGEVEKGRTVRDARFTDISRRIADALPGLAGVHCFQLIDDPDHGPCVFEINARFGGGYPLADRAGAPFARWLLEERLGRASSAHDGWREGVGMVRYDAAVFRDA